jgi:hypothetical protein
VAAGKSTLGTAQQMMLTVGQAYDAVVRGMARYLQHLREREAHLRAMLNDSHQPDVSAMLAEVVAAITALEEAKRLVEQGAGQARSVEART